MAAGLRELLVGDWWRYSVSLVGALLLAVGVSSVLLDGRLSRDEAIQLLALVVFCLLLIAVGARIAVEIRASHEVARVLGWTGLGVLAMATLGAWTAFVFERTVDTSFETMLVFLSVLAGGALFGAVVGYYEVRVRTLVERASRETARREFLDEQQETLSTLNRIFRHQILNDLSAISGRSELLAAEKIDAETATDSITRHSEHMEETVDRLDTIIDVLTHVTTRTDVPVTEAIDDACERARERRPDLSVEVADVPDAAVRADELLARALVEVLVNAVEHGSTSPDSQARQNAAEHGSASPPSQAQEHADGTVTVDAHETDGAVVIEISDDGPGMDVSPESAFEPNTRGADSDGDGLGLFLVDLIVDRYDGDVRVTEADDGTTVAFEIATPAGDGDGREWLQLRGQ